jgi:Cof subfamily protein (haloacid dehalogenase superfamily)
MAFDIDGTLVDRHHTVSKENRAAIDRARAAGIKIAIATGRSQYGIRKIAPQIGADKTGELLIGYNGGMVFKFLNDADHSEIIQEDLFKPKDVEKVFALAKKYKIKLITYTDNDDFVLANTKRGIFYWWMKKRINQPVQVYDVEKHKDVQVYKFISFGKTKNAVKYREELTKLKFETFAWSYVSKANSNIEVNPPKVDKGYGIKKLCELYKIKPEEVMYFGDGENDIAALDFVGEGVAMENASDKIKSHAKHVTGHHLKSGVAQMINKYLDSIK